MEVRWGSGKDAGGATRARLVFAAARTCMIAAATLLALAAAGGPVAAAPPGGLGSATLPVPTALRPKVDFWKKVFAEHSELDAVIHDRDDVSRVYKVLRFGWMLSEGATRAEIDARRRQAVLDEIERIRAILLRLHQRRGAVAGLPAEERRIAELFAADRNPHRFLDAADRQRIRAQSGLRERTARAMEISRQYLPYMERVFRAEGVPVEITRLPFVESSFDVTAYSRVGAAGLWQFMPATGKDYLRIDDAVDERRDPWLATVAAAKFLRGNYDRLQSWPLAITAYNHGRGGMMRAVDQLGTRDIVEVIRRYDGRTFGFASKNFYAEFVAVVEIERDHERYFGRMPRRPALQPDTVEMPAYVPFADVARAAGVPRDDLADLNLALLQPVLRGELFVPRGYRLRLPEGHAPRFRAQLASLPSASRQASRAPDRIYHRVRPGESLSAVARRYGVPLRQLMADNGLRNANHVRAGQRLAVRSSAASRRAPAPAAGRQTVVAAAPRGSDYVVHRVAPGQTLSTIARRYGTSVATIRRHNRIGNADVVRTGERLRIPTR